MLAQRADVSRPEDIEAFADAAVARWGRIDGVVHNAGRASAGALESIDDTTWEGDFQLKLMAAVRLTRLVLPQLRAAKGSVLFTLAMAAKAPGPASEPSSVTRAAGMALMKALSKELAPDGVRVNAVLIGLIESGQWVRGAAASGVEPEEFYERFAKDAGIPLGRFGRAAGVRRPGSLPAVGPCLVCHRDGDQPRWGAVTGRLRATRCSPRSPWRRRPRPAAARWRSRRSCRAG